RLFLERDLPRRLRSDLRGQVPDHGVRRSAGAGSEGDLRLEPMPPLTNRLDEDPGQPCRIVRGPHELEQSRSRCLQSPGPVAVERGQLRRDRSVLGVLPQQGNESRFKIPDLRLEALALIEALLEGLGACRQLLQGARAPGGPAWTRQEDQDEDGGKEEETRSKHGEPPGLFKASNRRARK